MKGAEGKEDIEKIHLEAVTDEIFRQMKEGKAQKRRSDDLPADAGADGDQTDVEQPKGESYIHLLLKAKGKADFKLRVKPVSYQPLINISFGC